MKKRKISGVSLINLMITVVVTSILAVVIIPNGIDKINSAKVTTFNENILTLKQEACSYLVQNEDYPIKLDGKGDPLVYSINSNQALIAEVTKKNDQNDIFYIIDLQKLNIDNKDEGIGKTIDDYYIMAKTSGNIYYAKGRKIGNITYFTKTNKGDGVIAVLPTSAPTPYAYLGYDGAVNSPKLSAGMTPVKWNGSSWINADSSNLGYDWYDYSKGANRWANVKLNDGSLLVWIPRFTYKILTNEHTGAAGDIDIHFSNTTSDDTANGYRIHPAFYWGGWNIGAASPMTKATGGSELPGIWVSKFEASALNAGQGTSGDNVRSYQNVASWRNMKISDMLDKCRAMQTSNSTMYGISADNNSIDTHLLKNSEWGAVAYLSKYSLGTTIITLNPSTSYITANGNIVTNKAQSTTGNEYGVYDMSGGTNEYVSLYLNNNNSVLNTYCSSLLSAAPKYKDVFVVSGSDAAANNYALANYAYGHAFYETSASGAGGLNGWVGAYSYFMETNSAVIERGGAYADGSTGGIFYFSSDSGIARTSVGFRVGVCVP